MSRLHFLKRILRENLRRTDSKYLNVSSLCADSAEELLLACGAAGLRALSLHTGQLAAREPTALRDDVRKVPFDAHTVTLLLLLKAANKWRSWCRCVATRANGSKCSASTIVQYT